MKRPALAFDKKTILDWLLRHGDKIVLTLLALVSLWLAWGGVDKFRSGGTREAERPDAIAKLATAAEQHIGSEKRLPPGELPVRKPLAAVVDPWRAPVVAATGGQVLRQPMFPEFSKRTRPEVLPIEDVRAVAGIAVVAPKAAAGKPQGAANAPGKLTPYVVVTALVPVARQEAEYKSRFSTVGFQSRERDTPVWVAYKLERAEVGPQGEAAWKTLLTGTAGFDPGKNRDWEVLAGEEGISGFLLGPNERTPAFCGPLPRLTEGAWGREAVHPWVADHRQAGQPEYRLLRYFDDDVQPTMAYSYRVKHWLANPNYNDPEKPEAAIPPQELENPDLVREKFLASAVTAASRPVAVPVPTRILVETMGKAQRPEMPKWKPGWVEILILGPSSRGKARALRSLVTEPGGMANVDERFADAKNPKPENRRSKGEDIKTDQLLVDTRGSQEDKDAIQEPFEMLFRRPDGGFEWVTASDSESLVDRYRDTLQVTEDTKPDQPANTRDNPFANPSGKKP